MSDFKAKLKFKEKGGRIRPVFQDYKGLVKFPFSESLTSGKHIFLDKDEVKPGDHVTAEISVLDHILPKGKLHKSMDIEIREGNRIIATGIILEVLNESFKRKNDP